MDNFESISPRKLTKQLELFRCFFISSWFHLTELMRKHDRENDKNFIENWIEINWEFLIERELLGNPRSMFLAPLSISLSDKLIDKESRANCVVVTNITQKVVDSIETRERMPPLNCPLRFLGFCTVTKSGNVFEPPFDQTKLILDSTGEQFIVPFQDLEFYLMKFEPNLKDRYQIKQVHS